MSDDSLQELINSAKQDLAKFTHEYPDCSETTKATIEALTQLLDYCEKVSKSSLAIFGLKKEIVSSYTTTKTAAINIQDIPGLRLAQLIISFIDKVNAHSGAKKIKSIKSAANKVTGIFRKGPPPETAIASSLKSKLVEAVKEYKARTLRPRL